MIALTFDMECLINSKKRKSEEINVPEILKLLDKYKIKSTFFVPGKVAEKFPELILKISKKGHEIGSHSYNHLKLASLSPKQQKEEIRKGKKVLEDLTSKKITGFRAPFLSFTCQTFEILKKEGFAYDSSAHQSFEGKLPVIELFCCLPDDYHIFESPKAVGTEKDRIEKWIETRKAMFDSLKQGEINIQMFHPWILAKNPERLKALDLVIRYIVEKNIEIQTCQAIIEKNFHV